MHIPDGILPNAIMVGTTIAAVGITAFSLSHVNKETQRALVPKASLLTAAFFIISALRIPLPPPLTNVHLLLVALMGAALGWLVFPALIIGLLLQAFIFTHGGISTLGANTLLLGMPALGVHFLFQWVRKHQLSGRALSITSFAAGFFGIAVAVLLFYAIIIGTLPAEIDAELERKATGLLVLSHLPIALIEGTFMALIVPYLHRVQPALLSLHPKSS